MLLLVLVCLFANSHQYDNQIVEISTGKIQGHILKNAESGKFYYAFRGIPFAKPPLGDLRFEPPQNPDKWNGILETKKDIPECLQDNNGITGSEDCLYLNVFTPQIPHKFSVEYLRPVMVWIYGGGFSVGTSATKITGPDFILDHDVILVNINYRVNVFGFLSTQDSVAEGNAGLKDQVAALRWVKENIAKFGGNPHKVTIIGGSAGAASVQYLTLSPLAKGLFHQAILQSGSSLCEWSLQRKPIEMAFRLGKALGIDTNDTRLLVKTLKNINATELLIASLNYTFMGKLLPTQPKYFVPCIERDHQHAFISQSSYHMFESGQYAKVPHLAGFNADEGLYAYHYVTSGLVNITDYENYPELLNPASLNQYQNSSGSKQAAAEIMSFGFYNESVTNSINFIEYMSQNMFIRSMRKFVHLMQNDTDIHFYKFTYKGGHSEVYPDRGHASELPYIFYTAKNESREDKLVRKRIVAMWTNFAKTGNPTPRAEPLLQNVLWERTSSLDGIGITYLDIGENLKLGKNVEQIYFNFWIQLLEQYGIPPFITW